MLYRRGDFLKKLSWSLAGVAMAHPISRLLAETAQVATRSAPVKGEYEVNVAFVNKGPGLGNRIALTFDDGPTPKVTEPILDELKKRKLKATFFMIGRRIVECPDLARRVVADGHEVANHTFTHPQLNRLTPEKVAWELEKCQDIISSTLNIQPVWFRPPYGAFRKNQGPLALAKGLGVAYWTVDPRDWARPGASRIANNVIQNARPGAIILLHDLHKQTAEAITALLDGLQEKEFQFATLSGFLGKPYSV